VTALRAIPDAELRVLIACGPSLVRAGYRALLEAERGVAAAGEARCGAEAIELAARLRPDAVLMDVGIADCDCIEATSRLSDARGLAVILVNVGDDDDEYVAGALRAGATGVLSKESGPDELVHAIEVAVDGGAVLPPALTRRLIAAFVSEPEPTRPAGDGLAGLTAREREVVALVALGLSKDEIAGQLVVSSATARTHVSRSMVKLRARDRAQLVVFAYESDLLLRRPA
jgi:DNA-binding NarL/FixJ family response regulator